MLLGNQMKADFLNNTGGRQAASSEAGLAGH